MKELLFKPGETVSIKIKTTGDYADTRQRFDAIRKSIHDQENIKLPGSNDVIRLSTVCIGNNERSSVKNIS